MSDDQMSLLEMSSQDSSTKGKSASKNSRVPAIKSKKSSSSDSAWGSLFDYSESQTTSDDKKQTSSDTESKTEQETKKKTGTKSSKPQAKSVKSTSAESKIDQLEVKESPETKEEEKSSEPEKHVYSVSELNRLIREQLEGRFRTIWIQGEISNFKAHTSGHHYFSLKDKNAQVNAVMFRGFNSKLKFRPETGMEVIVRGKVTVYEPRGNYQVFCEVMEPVGAGALQQAFEQLKAKLKKEGLFDQSKKRPLPHLPKHIAIVTSPTGAAIRDMLNVLGRRYKGAKISIIPASVQGDLAPASIVAGLKMIHKMKDVDVAIVGRGGGSMEDLWAFNDEAVAREVANCPVPIISAVGHEIDFTISDFVADLRAPTPSAAAELVAKNADELKQKINHYHQRMMMNLSNQFKAVRQKLVHMSRRLVDPQKRLQDLGQRNDELLTRVHQSLKLTLERYRMRLAHLREMLGQPDEVIKQKRLNLQNIQARTKQSMLSQLQSKRQDYARATSVLDSVSPLRVVERGYSIVSNQKSVIKDSSQLKEGDKVQIQFSKGRIEAEVSKKINDSHVSEMTKEKSSKSNKGKGKV